MPSCTGSQVAIQLKVETQCVEAITHRSGDSERRPRPRRCSPCTRVVWKSGVISARLNVGTCATTAAAMTPLIWAGRSREAARARADPAQAHAQAVAGLDR